MAALLRPLTARFESLASDRSAWDDVWRELAAVCFPSGPRDTLLGGNAYRSRDMFRSEPGVANRSRKMYDTTGAIALERVVAGIESLITPQGQTWHDLMFTDPQAPQPTLDEEAWFDSLTQYLFGVRYDPRSGWLLAHQRALMSTLALGTGVYFCTEAFGTRDKSSVQIPFRYVPVGLDESYLGVDSFGEHDSCIRSFFLSATQAMAQWGDANSDPVKLAAGDPQKMDKTSQFLHIVVPAEQVPGYDLDFPWTSIYLDLDNKHIIGESGYLEFPYIVYTWTLPTASAYGESPAMVALPEMKTLQVMSRDALLASQLNLAPPVATAYELDRPVNLNPRAINPKAVDPNTGRLLIQPILPPVDPRMAEATMELRRQHVRQALFTDLFAVLVDKPNMSATEAAIRAQEKGELLGPAASRIQVGLSRLTDRELAILERKGAFDPGNLLTPPDSVVGRDIGVKFVSPLDRARQLPEVTGMQQTMEFAAGLAQFAPDILDNFDTDEMFTRARYLLGAPPLAQKDPALVNTLRAEKAQALAMQQSMAQTREAIQTAGELAPAADGISAMSDLAQRSGIDPRQIAGIPQQ